MPVRELSQNRTLEDQAGIEIVAAHRSGGVDPRLVGIGFPTVAGRIRWCFTRGSVRRVTSELPPSMEHRRKCRHRPSVESVTTEMGVQVHGGC